MTISKTFKKLKGYPYKAIVKSYLKYDYKKEFTESATISEDDLTDYDGLSYTVEWGDRINFSNTILPDYKKFQTSRYALALSGSTYTLPQYVEIDGVKYIKKSFNGLTTGSPTITDLGIASGFSASNYLTTSALFPYSETSPVEVAEFISRVQTGDDTSRRYFAYGNSGVGNYNGYWVIYGSGSNNGGSYEYSTWYWVKVKQIYDTSTSTYTTYLYYLLDDGTYTSYLDLPDDSSFTQALALSGALFTNATFRIGTGTTTSQYWEGSIDLANTVFLTTVNNDTSYTKICEDATEELEGCIEDEVSSSYFVYLKDGKPSLRRGFGYIDANINSPYGRYLGEITTE